MSARCSVNTWSDIGVSWRAWRLGLSYLFIQPERVKYHTWYPMYQTWIGKFAVSSAATAWPLAVVVLPSVFDKTYTDSSTATSIYGSSSMIPGTRGKVEQGKCPSLTPTPYYFLRDMVWCSLLPPEVAIDQVCQLCCVSRSIAGRPACVSAPPMEELYR